MQEPSAQVIHQYGNEQLILYPGFVTNCSFDELVQIIPWKQNTIRLFGKQFHEPRLTAWFGPAYRYSGIQWPDTPFIPTLDAMKVLLTKTIDFDFNSVLLNYYRDGQDSMGWHRDNEKEMDQSVIASLSFGGSRIFRMKNLRNGEKLNVPLDDRSLLLMINMQEHWQHAVPKSARNHQPRINLTFRRIIT